MQFFAPHGVYIISWYGMRCYLLHEGSLLLNWLFNVTDLCRMWTTSSDVHRTGGQAQLGVSSVSWCKSVCIGNSQCTAFDWDQDHWLGWKCWLHGSWSGGFETWNGGTYYSLNRNCPSKKFKSFCDYDVSYNYQHFWSVGLIGLIAYCTILAG